MEKVSGKNLLKGFLSRKFILAVVAAVVAFGNSMWNWGLDEKQVITVIVPLLAYIGVEGIADIKSR